MPKGVKTRRPRPSNAGHYISETTAPRPRPALDPKEVFRRQAAPWMPEANPMWAIWMPERDLIGLDTSVSPSGARALNVGPRWAHDPSPHPYRRSLPDELYRCGCGTLYWKPGDSPEVLRCAECRVSRERPTRGTCIVGRPDLDTPGEHPR